MHSCPCHALMSEPFSMILFENKHNTWLLRSILLKHRNLFSYKITPKLKYAFLLLSSIYIMPVHLNHMPLRYTAILTAAVEINILGETFCCFFSSPEPKANRRAYSIPMVWRPLSSVVHNAQTSSQKPLGRSKPNFMWSLLG